MAIEFSLPGFIKISISSIRTDERQCMQKPKWYNPLKIWRNIYEPVQYQMHNEWKRLMLESVAFRPCDLLWTQNRNYFPIIFVLFFESINFELFWGLHIFHFNRSSPNFDQTLDGQTPMQLPLWWWIQSINDKTPFTSENLNQFSRFAFIVCIFSWRASIVKYCLWQKPLYRWQFIALQCTLCISCADS